MSRVTGGVARFRALPTRKLRDGAPGPSSVRKPGKCQWRETTASGVAGRRRARWPIRSAQSAEDAKIVPPKTSLGSTELANLHEAPCFRGTRHAAACFWPRHRRGRLLRWILGACSRSTGEIGPKLLGYGGMTASRESASPPVRVAHSHPAPQAPAGADVLKAGMARQ